MTWEEVVEEYKAKLKALVGVDGPELVIGAMAQEIVELRKER